MSEGGGGAIAACTIATIRADALAIIPPLSTRAGATTRGAEPT